MKKTYLSGLLALVMAVAVNWAVPAGAHDGHDTHDGSGPAGAGPAKHENMELTFISDDPPPGNQTNPDLAFWGNVAYVPNYGGLRTFDISGATPVQLSSISCPGPQNDVTVWDRDGNGAADILFLSVDSVMENKNCGAPVKPAPNQGNGPYDADDWEGIRIFDVSNPAAPVPLNDLAVYQDCGSHTHTLVPDPANNRVLLYNSSYSLRNGPSCGPGFAETGREPGRNPLHGVIQVVEVEWSGSTPLNNALLTAGELTELPVNYPSDAGNVFDPQAHGLPATSGGAPLNDLRACHDIGVFMELFLAAAACAEELQLWEIDPGTLLPDTANPQWTFDNIADTDGPGGGDSVTDFWHSATFSWDGKVINAIDESFGTGCPTVSPNTDPNTPAQFRGPSDSGRMYFIDTATGKELSQFQIPRPESAIVDSDGPGGNPPAETAYCSAHLGVQVPAAGRDLLVSSWYTGGVSVVDFTAVKNPKEVAYFDFDRTPGAAEQTGSNNWTAYWYDPTPGHNQAPWTAYGQDIGKGFEQFEVSLKTSRRFTLPFLNPQTQMEVLP